MRTWFCCCCMLLALAASAFAQEITSFETPAERALVRPSGLTAEAVAEHATQGKYSLQVTVKGSKQGTWPGLIYDPKNQDLSSYAIFAYDVFNPESFPVTISCRIDDASGHNDFPGAKVLPPGKTTTVQIWLTSLKYVLDLHHIKRIYPYFSRPARNFTLYLDNFRYETVSDLYKPMVYVETAPAPRPTEIDKRRGYLLFSRCWLGQVFPNSVPRPGERVGLLRAFGCPGETVNVTLSLRALHNLGQTSVSVGDLRCGAHMLPASAVSVYPLRCLDKRLTYSSDYYIKDMPTLLEHRPSVKVAQDRSQTFWLQAALPADTAAGVYRGQVMVTPTQGGKSSLPLEIRVLPYRLQEPKNMFWGEYYLKPVLPKTDAGKRAEIIRDLTDQRAHGMTSVGLCFGMEKGDWQLDGTRVTLHPRPDGLYATFMNTYKQLGFPMPVVQLADTGQAVASAYKMGTPEFDTTYKNFWIACARLQRERGWPEIIVQPVDEPGWGSPEARARNVYCLKLLKQIPGQRTEEDGPGDAYFIHQAGPYCDIWNFNGALGAPDVLAAARADGKIITSYNNDVESYRPEMDRYCDGFYQLRSNSRGTFNWAYICIAGNPYDDQDAKTGSWMHVYPPMPQIGEVGGASTGWEGARAGIDDYKYAFTLQQEISRGLASDNQAARLEAKQGQEALQAILDSIDYRPATRGTEAFTKQKSMPDGSREVFGQLKLPNGWDFTSYDTARWQIAAATMGIMAALGEIPTSDVAVGKVPDSPHTPVVTDLHWRQAPARTVVAPGIGQKNVAIPVVAVGPKCDGDLSDPVWAKAARLGPFTLMDGSGPPSQQTKVMVCADQTYLYFGVECEEQNIEHITARVDKDGGHVWEDDCVEFFFDPSLSHSSFLHIAINSLGKVYCGDSANTPWQPALLRGARVDTAGKRWFVELGVPLKSLHLTSSMFGLDVCRERRPLESLELSCWAPTGQGFGVPERFGTASLGGSYVGGFELGRGRMGANDFTMTLHNASAVAKKFLVILDWRQQKQLALYRQKGPISLAPGKSQKVTLIYEVVSDNAPVQLHLAVKDAVNDHLYAARTMQQQVLPAMQVTLKPHIYYLSEAKGQLQVDLNLDPVWRHRACLVMAVFSANGSTLLRRQVVPKLAGDHLDATVDFTGLKPGTYQVETILKLGPDDRAKRLDTVKTSITTVRGPFD